MTLVNGKSKKAVSDNLSIERRAGKDEQTAIAIAYSVAGQSKKKKVK